MVRPSLVVGDIICGPVGRLGAYSSPRFGSCEVCYLGVENRCACGNALRNAVEDALQVGVDPRHNKLLLEVS